MTDVAVRGRYFLADGTAATGRVIFTPRRTSNQGSGQTGHIIPVATVVAVLAEGAFTVTLQATDDPDLTPLDWTYEVREQISEVKGVRSYDIDVPTSAAGTGIDLVDVAPVSASDGDPTAFVTLTAFTALAADVAALEAGSALALLKASNLADLGSVSVARANLGLGTAATASAGAFEVAGAAARRKPQIALLGDSIPGQNFDLGVTVATNFWSQAKGFLTWAQVLSRQRFAPVYASPADGAFGSSGQTTTQIIAGDLAACAVSSADVVVVHAGTNDIGGGVAPATIAANLQTIWDTLVAAGKTVVATTILPRNNGDTATSTLTQNLRDTNRLIRSRAVTSRGVVLCDWYGALVDATTGLASTLYFSDGVHPNMAGAGRMGAVLAPVLAGLQPSAADPLALDNHDSRDVLPNSLMTGTAGAKSGANLTGNVATSCTATQIGTPTSIAASKVARTDLGVGEWQQFVVVAVAPTADGIQIQQQNTAVGVDWNIGDTVYLTVEFETDAAGWDCRSMHGSLDVFNGIGAATDLRYASSERTAMTAALYRPPSGILRTPNIVVGVGATRLQSNVYFYGSGTIRWGRMQIVKV